MSRPPSPTFTRRLTKNEAKDTKIGADVFEETHGAKDLRSALMCTRRLTAPRTWRPELPVARTGSWTEGNLVRQKRITSMEVYRCSISGVWVPPRYDIREFVPTAFLKGSPADQSSCFQTKTEMRIQDGLSSPSNECVRWRYRVIKSLQSTYSGGEFLQRFSGFWSDPP